MKDIILKALRDHRKSGNGYSDFEKSLQPIIIKFNISVTTILSMYKAYLTSYYKINTIKTQKVASIIAPYWLYLTSTNCKDDCLHSVLQGKIFKYDDPIWSFFMPPNDYGCECRLITYTNRKIERKNLIVNSSKGNLFLNDANNKQIPVFIDELTGSNISPHPDWCFDISEKSFCEVEEMILNYYLTNA